MSCPSKLVSSINSKSCLKMTGFYCNKWATVLLVLISLNSVCLAALSTTPATNSASNINSHRILDSLATSSCSSVHDIFEKRGVNKQDIPSSQTKGRNYCFLLTFKVNFVSFSEESSYL